MLHGFVSEGVLCGLIAVVVILQDGVAAGDMIVLQAVGFHYEGPEGRIYWIMFLFGGILHYGTGGSLHICCNCPLKGGFIEK